MLKVSIRTHGKPLRQVAKDIEKHWFGLQNELLIIGKETHSFMINFIQANKKRPPGAKNVLEDSISYNEYTLGYTAGFAIGDVGELTTRAPYWHAINYGSNSLVGKKTFGFFYPGEIRPHPSYNRQGRWYEEEELSESLAFPMTPKKPIPPMNFLENTNHFLGSRLSRMFAKAKAGRI